MVIKPKQPFVDWINNTPELDMDPPIGMAEMQEDCDSILLPDLDSPDEVHYFLEPLKPALFEMQLADWYLDPSVWPEVRDAETFDEWFALEVHSMVWDLVEEPLVDSEQVWRIMDLLGDAKDERQSLRVWKDLLVDELDVPFIAEVSEYYMLGPLKRGDRVQVTGVAGDDPLYGVLVDVKSGQERYSFPLCNLVVWEQGDVDNYQLVADYTVWFTTR
jgi:hypothetical protein